MVKVFSFFYAPFALVLADGAYLSPSILFYTTLLKTDGNVTWVLPTTLFEVSVMV